MSSSAIIEPVRDFSPKIIFITPKNPKITVIDGSKSRRNRRRSIPYAMMPKQLSAKYIHTACWKNLGSLWHWRSPVYSTRKSMQKDAISYVLKRETFAAVSIEAIEWPKVPNGNAFVPVKYGATLYVHDNRAPDRNAHFNTAEFRYKHQPVQCILIVKTDTTDHGPQLVNESFCSMLTRAMSTKGMYDHTIVTPVAHSHK